MIDDQAVIEQLSAAQACVDEAADAAIDALRAVTAAVEAFNGVHDRWRTRYRTEPGNIHLAPIATLANITANIVTAERLDLDRVIADLVDTARSSPDD